MTQKTLVVLIPKAQHTPLRDRLVTAGFEISDAPHAVFRARGEGYVATLYRSGKLVIQGLTPEMFVARHTDLAPDEGIAPKKGSKPRSDDEEIRRTDRPLVGSDETGKGDYFGPLVVAAVRLEPNQAKELVELGVADSKTLTDKKAIVLGSVLRKKVTHDIRCLPPKEYNASYSRVGNLNPMLADLHAQAIGTIAKPGDRVLIDQFANTRVMERALGSLTETIELKQAPKAERNVAVAAASILARQEFLVRMKELSDECGIELRKGGGYPVDAAGVAFVRANGMEALGQVAKLHFKNTQKIRALLSR